MEETRARVLDPDHPATAAIQFGLYRDRTLAQFEERIVLDPDHGTPHEGTVNDLPPTDGRLWEAQMEGLIAETRGRETTESRVVALAAQTERQRRAKRVLAARKLAHAIRS